jgi:fibrillarin-like rRNA methylase
MTQDHDTPRTDAAEMPLDRVDAIASRPACVVHADFARELERELIELQQQKRNCIEILDDDAKEMVELKDEVAFWKSKASEAEDWEAKHEAELSMWRDGGIMHSAHSNEIDELKAEVAELRENAQRIGANRYQEINTLRSQLNRAVEIAEGLEKYGIHELTDDLRELKREIK